MEWKEHALNILHAIYDESREDVPMSKVSLEYRIAIDQLINEGYVEKVNGVVGAVYLSITKKGIEYIEQNSEI